MSAWLRSTPATTSISGSSRAGAQKTPLCNNWRRAMKAASSLESAKEKDENDEKMIKERTREQPKACILNKITTLEDPKAANK
ncbi:hypothetical protein Lal_00004630 [Lupinus albus]|nr:hypothetical protein Lal_00004630 [Lupinus albus]